MKQIKLFCMQKDEEDILDEWILYHSYLFGIENIHIIDNHSEQQSQNILNYYKQKGLNVYTRSDYSKKGDYLCELIKENCNDYDIAIPLDLDEFIGIVNIDNVQQEILLKFSRYCLSFDNIYYLNRYPEVKSQCKINNCTPFDHFIKWGFCENKLPCLTQDLVNQTNKEYFSYIEKNQHLILKNFPQWSISCDREQIIQSLTHLPKYARYAFSYYLTSRNSEMEYDFPIEEVLYFDLIDMRNHQGRGNCNKKFFIGQLLNGLDHGNHYGKIEGLNQFDCFETNLILFHYHNRGINKLIQKCKNDILGLGHVKNIDDQRELKDKVKQSIPGSHNIINYLNYLIKGPYSLFMPEEEGILIDTMSQKIKSLKSELAHYQKST